MRFGAKTIGGLLALAVFGTTAVQSARTSFQPQPPAPGWGDLLSWVWSGNDLLAAFTALAAGISAGWSIWQMFQPSPATRQEVLEDIVDDGERTRGDLAKQGAASELRDLEMLTALKAQKHGFTPDDLREHRISEAKAVELGEALVTYLRQTRPELAGEMVARIGGVVARAAESADDRSRQVAALMAEGKFSEAGQLQREIAAGQDLESAQAHRDAASILVLTDLGAAISEYTKASELDPTHFWTWVELSRLYSLSGSMPEAARVAQQAKQRARTDRDQMVSDSLLGDLASDAGRHEEALSFLNAAVQNAKRIVDADADNDDALLDLSTALVKLGRAAERIDNLDRARDEYTQALAIREALVDRAPDDLGRLRSLSVVLDDLGDVELRADNLPAARGHYSRDLALAEQVVDRMPTSREALRDLAISHRKVGQLALRARDFEDARRRLSEAYRISFDLAATDSRNLQARRDLGVCLSDLGDIALVSGEAATAVHHLSEALVIRQELAARDPQNVLWQRDWGSSHYRLGMAQLMNHDLMDAEANLEKAKGVFSALASVDQPQVLEMLQQVENALTLLRAVG